MLYKMVDLEEGAEVRYLAVYVLRWRPEWGQPQYGFVESGWSQESIEQLDGLRLHNLRLATEQAVLCREAKARVARLEEAIRRALPFIREMECYLDGASAQWANKVHRLLLKEIEDAKTSG
jgi:hypothetical protein